MQASYGQYCPIALATEIFGERWTLLVVVALLDDVERFNDLQRALPRISPSVLARRLRSLEDVGIVTKRLGRQSDTPTYHLTQAGHELEPILTALGQWGQRWARDLESDDMDPLFLAWSMHLRMNCESMPPGRTVIEFEFSGVEGGDSTFWIVANDGKVDLCIRHPGHRVDLEVHADLPRFLESWRGFRSLEAEVASGRIRLRGPVELKRAFPRWLRLSVFADEARCRPGNERRISRRAARARA